MFIALFTAEFPRYSASIGGVIVVALLNSVLYVKPTLLTFFCTFSIAIPLEINAAENNGERLFLENCAECHQADGKGIPEIYPSLAGNELVVGSGVDVALVLIIGRGEMPSFDGAISSDEMAAIVNYVRNSFGNEGDFISAETIDSLK